VSYWTAHNDLLNRKDEAAYLIRFLQQRIQDRSTRGLTSSYVLNIDAAWGEGKTFFMRGLLADLQAEGHPAIMIDAWRDDFSGDPLTAVVAEFDQFVSQFKSSNKTAVARVKKAATQLRRQAGKLAILTAKGAGKRLIAHVTGEGSEEITAILKGAVSDDFQASTVVAEVAEGVKGLTNEAIDKYATAKLERFNEAKTSLSNFQLSLEKTVEALTENEFTAPFFILIDELDRCRPTYAIEMLERIKHLFEAKNVVFVLSTDTTQLANSIKAVYGNEFDSRHYLMRFFDRSYMLASPDRKNLVRWHLENALIPSGRLASDTGIDPDEIVVSISDQFKLEVRQIVKAIDMLSTITTVWRAGEPIEIAFLFPMIAAFLTGNDLSTDKKVREVFRYETSPHNYSNRGVSGVDIGEAFAHIYGRKSQTFRQIFEEVGEVSHANTDAATRILQAIAHAEMQALGSRTARPLIGTYAERVRMAGRFRDR
jgi:hypothetical protein